MNALIQIEDYLRRTSVPGAVRFPANGHPVSQHMLNALEVAEKPEAFSPQVQADAANVLDWFGVTEADRAKIIRLPLPDMVTGAMEAQLAEARRTADLVAIGEPVSLPVLMTAAEVLETHGCTSEGGQDSAALIRVEAAAMLKRMQARKVDAPRRGVIRGEIMGIAGLAVICAAALVLLRIGGV
jgi:hypothetical protein